MARSPDEIRRRACATWFADAKSDLANARTLSTHRDEATSPFAAAFHAEQAVEKALKALLIIDGIDFPPRHDLGLLVGLLPAGAAIRSHAVAGLTVYAVEQRYVSSATNPMDLNERPTWEEADDAILTAEKALAAASADLAAFGLNV